MAKPTQRKDTLVQCQSLVRSRGLGRPANLGPGAECLVRLTAAAFAVSLTQRARMCAGGGAGGFVLKTTGDSVLAGSLRGRVPGQAVMTKLLAEQRLVPPRSRLHRFFGLSPLSAETRSWHRGALGEVVVGRRLARLGAGWFVLHAVPVGAGESDIDHVVIGPGGVFTINTKNHAGQDVWVAGGTFMVAGQRQQHIRNAEHESQRAARLLSSGSRLGVRVQPVIAVVDPKKLTIKRNPQEAIVLTARQLPRWLKRRQKVLSHEHVLRVLSAAERPSTWRGSVGETTSDGSAVQAAFSALDREVRRARLVRLSWAGTLVSSVALVFIANGPALMAGLVQAVLP